MQSFKFIAALLITATAFTSCSAPERNREEKTDKEEVSHELSVWDEEGDNTSDLSLESKKIEDNYMVINKDSDYSIVCLDDPELDSDKNDSKVQIIRRGHLYQVSNYMDKYYVMYGFEGDISDYAEEQLDIAMADVEITEDLYMNYSGDTYTDLTENRGVQDSQMHGVCTKDGPTVIFLRFATDELTEEYFDYYSSDLFDCYNEPVYIYEGDGYRLISDSTYHMTYITGHCFLSIASGYTYGPIINDNIPYNTNSDLVSQMMNLPQVSYMRALLCLMGN